jgi:HAD superfamily hydrolase (TIGR01509 family)
MLQFDPKRHDAVVFDCDGTLVDTMPLHHEAWCEAFRQHGAPFDFTWSRFLGRAGMTLEQTVTELNREFNCKLDPIAVANAQRAAYLRRHNEIKAIDFVINFAYRLRNICPLAVASGSNQVSVTHALSRIGILDWFDVVITASDVPQGKPAPDVFLLAASQLRVSPQRCLVVEDGQFGIEAARRAGMDAYLITRDGSTRLFPSESGDTSSPAAPRSLPNDAN